MKRVQLLICFQMFKLFWPQASKCLSLGFSHQLEKYTYKLLQSLLNSLIMCIVMLSSVQTVLDACMSGKCLQDLYFYSVLIWYELDAVKNHCNDFKFMSNETLIGRVDEWRRWIVLFFQIANVVVDCMVQKQSSTTILVPTSLFGAIEIERLQRMYVIGILSSENHCVTFCEVVGASVKTNRFCFVLFFYFDWGYMDS